MKDTILSYAQNLKELFKIDIAKVENPAGIWWMGLFSEVQTLLATQSICAYLLGILKDNLAYGIGGLFTLLTLFNCFV